MLVDLLMPNLNLRRGPARVGLWIVDVGATVLCGDGVLEVSVDGASIELPSPAEGILHASSSAKRMR